MNALAALETRSEVSAADPSASASADEIHYGTVIAANYKQAVQINHRRGFVERVTSRMGESFLRNMKMWLHSRRW